MEEFIRCIQEDKEPLVNGLDGKIAVQMGCAAKESLAKNSFEKVNFDR